MSSTLIEVTVSSHACSDHQQLRPAVTQYNLAKIHKLDISLFERLVNCGMRHVTLQTQRRMHPEVSSLIRPAVYKTLLDSPSTRMHPTVRGMKHRVFFMAHTVPEDGKRAAFGSSEVAGGVGASHLRVGEINASSKSNAAEAHLVVGLLVHLLLNGYSADQLVVLSMYNGQVGNVRRWPMSLCSSFIATCGPQLVLLSKLVKTMAGDPKVCQRLQSIGSSASALSNVRMTTTDNFQVRPICSRS